jgi:DNA-binding SARP family transcriptional activator/tetratricopeptide (TPR) repeat protein
MLQPGGLKVSLLGDPSWALDGREAVKLSAKDAALLAKLAIDGPQARVVICDLLWPESGPQKAEANLRQRASRLGKPAGKRVIELGAQVQLASEVAVDVLAISAAPNEVLLGLGTLLAGHDFGDNDALDRWLAAARERVTDLVVKELTDRAQSLENAGSLRDALPLAARAVELAPVNEHGWRRMIRLHYLRDDLASARDYGMRMASVLRDELGSRPSEETLQLMQTVEAGRLAEPVPRRPVPVSLLRPPVLVGRQSVWQAMSGAWQRPQPFLLVGDAGQGKSRLLEEFLRGQAGLVVDKAQPGDESSPYAVLGRVLVSLDREFAPALPALVRGELARIRPEFGSPPSSVADGPLLWHAVEQLLAAALPLGLAGIAIDDLHNADVATLDALCWLSARPSLTQLKLGLAARPLPAGAMANSLSTWLAASHHPVQLTLDPLTPEELATLLSTLALPSLLDTNVAARLYRHAGGHLLFTLATLQDAIRHGTVFGADAWPRPNSIQALLDERLRSLPDEAQSLIRIAAVAGADFTADRAARLLDRPMLDLVDTWAALEAADVLRGEAFSHDLVFEAALRSVPEGVRRALHRNIAELLGADSTAHPSRIGWHWEEGGRWAEAARSWHAAGDMAQLAGRLGEQIEFYERAAELHGRAGDTKARFESLLARLEGLRMRHGGAAVLARLPEVQALAETGVDRLRCELVRAQAWLDGVHGKQAAAAAEEALREAEFHPQWQAEAGALHAQALVQCGQFDAALRAGHAALAAADLAPPSHRLSALSALSYIHYAEGLLPEAVRWQREAVAEAERQQDHTRAAIDEGNVAALLASIGDVPATYAQAQRTRKLFAVIGVAENSTFGIVNHVVLGASAAALGQFGEALESLQAAVAAAGEGASTVMQAKSRLALAQLWLTLGRGQDALAVLDTLPKQLIPGMQIQAVLLRARAGEQMGLPTKRYVDELQRLSQEHRNLPLVQSAWFEASYIGDASEMTASLRRVREQCESLGLTGTARSLQWRELVRWLDISAPEASANALALAQGLEPFADSGTSAKCYPPEIWWTLARTYERAGKEKRRSNALASGRRWIEVALARVPAQYRQDFEQRNQVNRRLLSASDSGGRR